MKVWWLVCGPTDGDILGSERSNSDSLDLIEKYPLQLSEKQWRYRLAPSDCLLCLRDGACKIANLGHVLPTASLDEAGGQDN